MESFAKTFMTGDNGNCPEDYYYTFNAKGAKYYYSYLTGKRVAKKDIPPFFLNKIQEKDINLDIGELNKLKQGYLKEIKRLEEKVNAINIKLSHINDEETIKNCEKRREEREKKTKIRVEDLKKEREEEFRRIFEKLHKEQPKEQPKVVPLQQKNNILEELKITNKGQWRKWLIKNHPDKGGNKDLCQQVIMMGRSRGW